VNDNEVLSTLRNYFAEVHLDTPVDTLIAAGRSRHRQRVLTGLAATAAVAVAGLTFAMTGTNHSAGETSTARASVVAPVGVHIKLAGFTVDTVANGSVSMTLTKAMMVNATDLQHALTKAGVTAKVITSGPLCEGPDLPALGKVLTATPKNADGGVSLLINPRAMPTGTVLIFYVLHDSNGASWGIRFVAADSPVTCTNVG
jgi:hypothetical protein